MTTFVAILVVSVSAMVMLSERRMLKDEISQGHKSMLERLVRVSVESYYQNDVVLLNYFKALHAERGFVAAAFCDDRGLVQVHSDPMMVGRRLTAPGEDQ